MSLPNSSAQNAISEAKKHDCRQAGAAVVKMLKNGIYPLDIMTTEAFENAITVVIALGGSTNAVLHLLAIAHAAKVKLTIDDFTRIGKRVPVLADLKPSGKHLMSELVAIGGIRPLMKMLLDKGLLHGDALTVTGLTMAQTLTDVRPYPAGQTIIHDFDDPIKKDSHLVILRGNLAPEGAVAKISGKEGLKFTGKAIVFESEEAALQAILDGPVKAGHVIVIRSEGPKGGPGMGTVRSTFAPNHFTGRALTSWGNSSFGRICRWIQWDPGRSGAWERTQRARGSLWYITIGLVGCAVYCCLPRSVRGPGPVRRTRVVCSRRRLHRTPASRLEGQGRFARADCRCRDRRSRRSGRLHLHRDERTAACRTGHRRDLPHRIHRAVARPDDPVPRTQRRDTSSAGSTQLLSASWSAPSCGARCTKPSSAEATTPPSTG